MSDFKKIRYQLWCEYDNYLEDATNNVVDPNELWIRADFVKNVLFIAEYDLNNTTKYACWEEALQDIRKALGLLDDAHCGEGQTPGTPPDKSETGIVAREEGVSGLPTTIKCPQHDIPFSVGGKGSTKFFYCKKCNLGSALEEDKLTTSVGGEGEKNKSEASTLSVPFSSDRKVSSSEPQKNNNKKVRIT